MKLSFERRGLFNFVTTYRRAAMWVSFSPGTFPILAGFDSVGTLRSIHQAAFGNPDSSRVLVVANPGPARTPTVQLGAVQADVALDKDSVTTRVWSKEV